MTHKFLIFHSHVHIAQHAAQFAQKTVADGGAIIGEVETERTTVLALRQIGQRRAPVSTQ
jgi:hypothetical protein